MALVQTIELRVRYPDVKPEDVSLIKELYDETPEFQGERRQILLDLYDRLCRMLLTAEVGK